MSGDDCGCDIPLMRGLSPMHPQTWRDLACARCRRLPGPHYAFTEPAPASPPVLTPGAVWAALDLILEQAAAAPAVAPPWVWAAATDWPRVVTTRAIPPGVIIFDPWPRPEPAPEPTGGLVRAATLAAMTRPLPTTWKPPAAPNG